VPLEHAALILLLAVSTYACRAGGYVAMRFVRLTPRMRQWLDALPLAVMGAFLAPSALEGGVAETAGLVVTVAVTRIWNNSLTATLAGVAVVAALRAVPLSF
jgi:uncharacterized membrane protein